MPEVAPAPLHFFHAMKLSAIASSYVLGFRGILFIEEDRPGASRGQAR
jgi:hypothetical protein